jgi:hypothetical protein
MTRLSASVDRQVQVTPPMTTTPLTIMNLKGSICRLETVMAGTVGDRGARDFAFARLTLEATGRGVVLHIDGSKAEELKGLSYRRKDNAGVNVSGLDAPRQICVHKAKVRACCQRWSIGSPSNFTPEAEPLPAPLPSYRLCFTTPAHQCRTAPRKVNRCD